MDHSTRFVALVRHGQSRGNVEHRFHGGRLGGELSELGREQADVAAQLLRARLAGSPIRVVTSPLGRALQTARLLSDALSAELHEEAALKETDFGDWTGRLEEEVLEAYPLLYPIWLAEHLRRPVRPPDGESFVDVRERVMRAFVAHTDRARADGRHLVLVAHNGPLQAIASGVLGGPKEAGLGACAITLIAERDGGWRREWISDARGSNWHDFEARGAEAEAWFRRADDLRRALLDGPGVEETAARLGVRVDEARAVVEPR